MRFIWSIITYEVQYNPRSQLINLPYLTLFQILLVLFTCFFCVILSKSDVKVVGSVPVYMFLAFSMGTVVVFFMVDATSLVAIWLFPLSVVAYVTVPMRVYQNSMFSRAHHWLFSVILFIPKVLSVTIPDDTSFELQIGTSVLHDNGSRDRRQMAPKKVTAPPKTPAASEHADKRYFLYHQFFNFIHLEFSHVELLDLLQQKDNTIGFLSNKLLQKKNQLKMLRKKLAESEEETWSKRKLEVVVGNNLTTYWCTLLAESEEETVGVVGNNHIQIHSEWCKWWHIWLSWKEQVVQQVTN